MIAEAELKTQQCWDNCSAKIRQLVESFEGLQQVMALYPAINPNGSSAAGQIHGTIY